MLTREQIFSRLRTVREIEVPEWGGSVCIRALSGLDVMAWRDYQLSLPEDWPEQKQSLYSMAAMAAMSVSDEDGKPIMSLDDVETLINGSQSAIAVICNAALELNGLGEAGEEDIAKNS